MQHLLILNMPPVKILNSVKYTIIFLAPLPPNPNMFARRLQSEEGGLTLYKIKSLTDAFVELVVFLDVDESPGFCY